MKGKGMRTFSRFTIFAYFFCLLAQSAFPQTTTYAIYPDPATINESAGILLFTIVRSGRLAGETLRVSTTTSEGYLNNGDYTNIFQKPVSFLPGQQSQTISVEIIDDPTTVETNETFGFIVQQTTGEPNTTYLAKSTFTITDDGTNQPTYFISPNPNYVNEQDGNVTFSIGRSGPTPAAVLEARTMESEGYVNNLDYVERDQTVPFATGQTAASFSVNLYNDTIPEYDETFGVIVQRNDGNPGTNYLAKGTFTILDDDRPPTPLITNPRLNGTTFSLSVGSQAGFEYVLEYKNTLDGAVWNPVQTNSGNNGIIGLTNTGVLDSNRFYRVHVRQQEQE
jgi:hypothetical protein